MDASNHETAKVRNHETATCVIHHRVGPLAGGRGNTCEPTSRPTKTPTREPVQNASNPSLLVAETNGTKYDVRNE